MVNQERWDLFGVRSFFLLTSWPWQDTTQSQRKHRTHRRIEGSARRLAASPAFCFGKRLWANQLSHKSFNVNFSSRAYWSRLVEIIKVIKYHQPICGNGCFRWPKERNRWLWHPIPKHETVFNHGWCVQLWYGYMAPGLISAADGFLFPLHWSLKPTKPTRFESPCARTITDLPIHVTTPEWWTRHLVFSESSAIKDMKKRSFYHTFDRM